MTRRQQSGASRDAPNWAKLFGFGPLGQVTTMMEQAIVFECRISWKQWYVLTTVLTIGLVVALCIVAWNPAIARAFPLGSNWAIVGAWAALVALSAGLQTLNWFGSKLTVTPQRVILRKGIISRNEDEIRISDVRNIVLRQSICGRILDYGNVGFSTAGQSNVEVTMFTIDNPRRVREIVQDLRPS